MRKLYQTIKVSIVRGGVTQIHSERGPGQNLNIRKFLKCPAVSKQEQFVVKQIQLR